MARKKKKKKYVARRQVVKGKSGAYAHRNRKGQFSKWTSRGKSSAADRRRKSRRKPKHRGQGHRGDY